MVDHVTGRTILTVVGARPQFIKAVLVSNALRPTPGLSEVLVHTGQHYDREMSDVFFRELGLPEPNYELSVGSGTHGSQTEPHARSHREGPAGSDACGRAGIWRHELLPVVPPIHPRTRRAAADADLIGEAGGNLLLNPLGYLDMVRLEKDAAVMVTDSGGVQKEAFFYEVPCVTLRRETEWTELVALGWNRLAPLDSSTSVTAMILAPAGQRGQRGRPYGNGRAAEQMARI